MDTNIFFPWEFDAVCFCANLRSLSALFFLSGQPFWPSSMLAYYMCQPHLECYVLRKSDAWTVKSAMYCCLFYTSPCHKSQLNRLMKISVLPWQVKFPHLKWRPQLWHRSELGLQLWFLHSNGRKPMAEWIQWRVFWIKSELKLKTHL